MEEFQVNAPASSTADLWLFDGTAHALVLPLGYGFTETILFEDCSWAPGFTLVYHEVGVKRLGKARLRVDGRDAGDTSALLGRLFVRDGAAFMSCMIMGDLDLVSIPLAEADQVSDGDYGFGWSLEYAYGGDLWAKCYEGDANLSWLNGWRPIEWSPSAIAAAHPESLLSNNIELEGHAPGSVTDTA